MSDGSFNGHPFTIVRRDVVFGVALYTIGYLGGGYETLPALTLKFHAPQAIKKFKERSKINRQGVRES